MPVRETVGLLPPFDVSVRVALYDCAAAGANLTGSVQLDPPAIAEEQVLPVVGMLKSAAPVPLMAGDTVSDAVPRFLMVRLVVSLVA